MRIEQGKTALLVLLSVWAIFLLALYAFRIPVIDSIIASYPDLFFFVSIVICAYALGSFLTGTPLHRTTRFSELSELFPVSIGIGLWIFSLIAVILSFSGMVRRSVVISLILIILLFTLALITLSGRKRQMQRASPFEDANIQRPDEVESASERHQLFERSMVGLIAVIMILTFCFFLRPPIHYDTLEYHLSIPSEIITNNALPYFSFDVHSNFPMNVEMLYLLSLLLSGWKLANLLNYIFFPLAVLLVYLFTRGHSGRSAALIAAALFSSTYTVIELATHPLVDLQFTFFTASSFILLVSWLYRDKKRHFFLSALLAGIALGIKYTAFIFVVPLNILFLIIFICMRREKLLGGTAKVFLYLLVVFAVASPWLIRNYLNTGDPVFPIAAQYIGSETWTEEQNRLLTRAANGSPRDLAEIPKLPIRMSFSETDFGSFSWIGPVYLLFLPLIVLYRKDKIDCILILYAVLFFLLWAFSFNMMRFALPLLLVLSILTGRAIKEYVLLSGSHFFKKAVLFLTVCAVGCNLLYFVAREVQITGTFDTIFGGNDGKSFLSLQLPHYRAIDSYNKIADENSKILFIGETRTFYCQGKAVWSSAYNENPLVPIVRNSATHEGIADKLKSQGFTHLLYSPSEMIRLKRNYGAYDFSDEEVKRMIDFFTLDATVLSSSNHVYLLQIK